MSTLGGKSRFSRSQPVRALASVAFLAITLLTTTFYAQPSQAEPLPSQLGPISLSASQSSFPSATNQIAQRSAPAPQFIPTDVTPFAVSGERTSFSPGYKFRIFQHLPARMWFNSTTEVSQRYETNVFFTYSKPKSDLVFRVVPNITIGYNVLKNTSVYCNYFVIKDQFAQHPHELNFPTTMSLSMGVRQDIPVTRKTNLQLDFQARELWQTSHLHQFDFIPAINLTQVITPNHIVFASVLLQMRGREFFVAPTRELDPFYTVGYVYRRGSWVFLANNTIVNNWRSPPFRGSIPQQGNAAMIADIEISHPIIKKFPALLGFVRAEPIYNWSSHKAPGLSGFDFRLFTGLRLTLNKPSYASSIENLRKQLLESEAEPAPKAKSISLRPAEDITQPTLPAQAGPVSPTTSAVPTTSSTPPPSLIIPPWEKPMKVFIHQPEPEPAASPVAAPPVTPQSDPQAAPITPAAGVESKPAKPNPEDLIGKPLES